MANPTILAFDTSGPHCSAALMIGGKVVATRHENMKRGQAERLFPMLKEVMGEVGAVWEEIDSIGVGIGPGNFTGIRIAVSSARGLAMSLCKPAVGVSTFKAYYTMARNPNGRTAVFVPGPKNGVYFQIFQDGQPDGAPFLEPEESLHCPPWSQSLDNVVGLHGDGLIYSITYDFGPAGMTSAPQPIPIEKPTELTAAIAQITVAHLTETVEHPRPAPLYIRPADAAPRREAPVTILP